MLQRVLYLTLILMCLHGCGSESNFEGNDFEGNDFEGNDEKDTNIESTEESRKYFIKVPLGDDLMIVSTTLTNDFDSVIILRTLPSSHSLLVKSSIDDYSLIQSYGYEFTDYYDYNETNDFTEIVNWSHFFISEEDAAQWKIDVDSLYYLMPNETVELNLGGMILAGRIEENEITTLGNRYVRVNLGSQGAFFSVLYGSASVSGRIYPANNDRYTFKFKADYGYVIPTYELRYLQGALELN